jgi:hypothetical protein
MTIVKLLVNVLKSMIYFKNVNVFCIKKFKQEWHASFELFLNSRLLLPALNKLLAITNETVLLRVGKHYSR